MNTKLKLLSMSAGILLAGMSSSANALSWFSPVTAFEDDDIDMVFDNDGSGTLSVGDRLVAVAEYFQTLGELPGQDPISVLPGEVTAVSDITITSILQDGTYIFGASGASGLLSAFGAGTAVAVYYDPSPDLVVNNASCGTLNNCAQKAGLGLLDGSNLFFTAGFFGDADAAWSATAQNGGGLISTVQNGQSTSKFGAFNFALEVGINNTGRTLLAQDCSPFCNPVGDDGKTTLIGSGDILGGRNLGNGWTARSDSDFQLATVPEPTTLGLLGIGLLAMGRSRAKA